MSQDEEFKRTFDELKLQFIRTKDCHFLRHWNIESIQDPAIVEGDSQNQIIKRYAGGNFQCTTCGKQWFSRIHSSILFQHDKRLGKGLIKWKLFGQQCKRCKGAYIEPYYEPESIEQTIYYLLKTLARKNGIQIEHHDPTRPTVIGRGEDDLTCYCEACRIARRYCEK